MSNETIKKAHELIQSGQLDMASDILKKDIGTAAEGVEPEKYVLACINLKQGAYEESYLLFKEIYQYLLDQVSVRQPSNEMIELFLLKKDYEPLIVYINKYLSFHPDDINNLFIKGVVLRRSKNYDKAEDLFLKLVKMKPDNWLYLKNLAGVYDAKDDCQKAVQYYEQAYVAADKANAGKAEKKQIMTCIINWLFERKGECDSCKGKPKCCLRVMLVHDGKFVASHQNFAALLARDARNCNWVHTSEDKEGRWYFSCSKVGPDGRCMIYEQRSDICRGHPDSLFALMTGCSYSFVLKKELPLFYSDLVLSEVKAFLERMQGKSTNQKK